MALVSSGPAQSILTMILHIPFSCHISRVQCALWPQFSESILDTYINATALLLVMFHESHLLHLWAALFLVGLLQEVPVRTCSRDTTPLWIQNISAFCQWQPLLGSNWLWKFLWCQSQLMWTFAAYINASGLFCCIITIWLFTAIYFKRVKDGILRTCPSLVL